MHLFSREPSKWQVEDVEHLGRLVFSLSTKQINSIPLVCTQKHNPMQIISLHFNWFYPNMHDYIIYVTPVQTVLNKDTVEQVLVGQQRWADSLVGGVCITRCMDEQRQRQQTQSLIRGIVKAQSRRAKS